MIFKQVFVIRKVEIYVDYICFAVIFQYGIFKLFKEFGFSASANACDYFYVGRSC